MNKSYEKAAAIAATSALLTGCSALGMESSYDSARKEAVSTMNSVTPEDLVSCEVTSAEAGDASVVIEYDLGSPEAAAADPWLRDGGTEVDGKHLEVTWIQRLAIEHTLGNGDVLPGVIEGEEDQPFLENIYGSIDGHKTVTIPLNTHFQGPREVDPQIRIDSLRVGMTEREFDEPFYVSCGKIAINLTDTHVDIIDY